jgi:hypothetical protein
MRRVELTPPPDVSDRQGVFCGMACSTGHVCSAGIFFVNVSRQQYDTFARITRPHRREQGRVRFFYGPPIRWGGMLVYPRPGG